MSNLEDADERTGGGPAAGTALDRFTGLARGEDARLPAGYEAAGSLAVNLARAEIDQQIATARALPRTLSNVVRAILNLATLDEETSVECVYALPRAGKAIKGPSIRLAEIIVSQWGNCRTGSRVVHTDRFEKFVEAEGVFHDLETNTATTSRVRRRLSDKKGKLLSEDMIIVTGNAACAIAKRNAILGGVPKAVWRKAYDAVEQVISGDVKTLGERREKALKAFAAFGVTPDQLFTALEVKGLDDIGLEQIVTLTGMHSAIKNNESTVEEMFAPMGKLAPAEVDTRSGSDRLAATGEAKAEPAAGKRAGVEGEKQRTSTPAATTAKPEPEKAKPAAETVKAPVEEKPKEEAKPKAAITVTPEAIEQLRRYHLALGTQMSVTGLQKRGAAIYNGEIPDEGTPLGDAAVRIFGIHIDRIGGKVSPADADRAAEAVIGKLA